MVHRAFLAGLNRLRRCFKPRRRRPATEPCPEVGLLVVPAPKEPPRTYFDFQINWVLPLLPAADKRNASARFGKKWESFEERLKRYMADDEAPILPNRNSPCPLMWLSLEIRAKIWKYAFDANDEGLLLKNDAIIPNSGYSVRLFSCLWAEETWSAYINALATRTLVVLEYPKHGYLEMPCPIFADLQDVRLRAIKFVLGDKYATKAELRNREFTSFMLARRDSARFTARTVILEFKENWLTSAFSEMNIADLLKCSFCEIERVRFQGAISPKQVERLLQRIHMVA